MIPAVDLQAQYAALEQEIDAAIKEVLRSAEFIEGPPVRELERRIAAYCGVRHARGVASGTDALILALKALGVGPGDEVITTSFSFIATASAISQCGATPVFVDIDERTYNLDVAALPRVLTPRTRALLPVHLYGQPADMGRLMEFARTHELHVIEDCAQALGAHYDGRPVGSFGKCGCLSFFPTKNLGGCGDGGMVVTNDAAFADRIDLLRKHGSKHKYVAEVVGTNSRLDSLQAAILNVKLRHLDSWNRRRAELAARYDELLADVPVIRPWQAPNVVHVYHQYTIRTGRRDALAAALQHAGIGCRVYYPVPLHRQRLYESLGYGPGSLPISERCADEVLSLPLYPELTDAQVVQVADAIKEFFRS